MNVTNGTTPRGIPTSRAVVSLLIALVVTADFAGCYSEADATHPPNERPMGAGTGGASEHEDASVSNPPPPPPKTDSGPPKSMACTPARAGEKLPARTVVMSAPVAQKRTMLVGELFSEFDTKCGGCHVDLGNGDYRVARATFATDISRNLLGEDIGREAIDRIFADEDPMPPDIAPASERDSKSDPYLELGALLKLWFEQGKPADSFELPAEESQPPAEHTYLLTDAVGTALTNLGNCIPEYLAQSDADDALDDRFRGDSLPQTLAETDLTTLDSAELAKHGVVAYAPAYPLWSEGSHKMRHVRVPRGQSIVFDKTTQTFKIPENTRFYKTFSKKVVEKGGKETYRKIETRLIVARSPEVVDGVTVQRALFGTYEWDPINEKEATLSNEPRLNGTPFADHLLTYITDEQKHEDVLSAHRPTGDLTRELQGAGAIRHYAVPGSERCVRCHMGSPNQSFTLGFLPLQIKWRPSGEGGVIEHPEEDELNQLQRLIDYGVITGMASPDDVINLEDSQGDRPPRNDQELVAQGYVLGNCAHCHNPLGFPTVQNPELEDLLNFLPGPGQDEGIFQFPLERYSPRIGRGAGGITKMPYITPSLVDFPSSADWNRTVSYEGQSSSEGYFRPDYMALAPWRSLIYRNVDTPFPYSVDVALFPHMPMDTPGFDCRAPQILGEWMVSIPARIKPKTVRIDEVVVQASVAVNNQYDNDPTKTDHNEQPYTEIKEGEYGYELAVSDARARVEVYKTGNPTLAVLTPTHGLKQPKFYPRYQYCPDTTDIIDPTVTGSDKRHLVPADLRFVKGKDLSGAEKILKIPTAYDPVAGYRLKFSEDLEPVKTTDPITWPDDGVPDRAHWVSIDSSEPGGEWSPRRSDWKKYLVEHAAPDSRTKTKEELRTEALALHLLTDAKLSPRSLEEVSKPVAFGLWKDKPECASKFAKARIGTVSELFPQGSDAGVVNAKRPLWMDANPEATPNARVYSELPGAAVYNMVCVNCHGPRADSRGRQADTLQFMTGGDARVANFINGLFGPTAAPGTNRDRVFAVGRDSTPDDWAARYLAWMALGGTEKLIPKGILNVVSVTPVLGQVRRFEGADSANMLGPVQFLCAELHGYRGREAIGQEKSGELFGVWLEKFPDSGSIGNVVWDQMVKNSRLGDIFLRTIGDAELWATLCSLDNPMPIRVIDFATSGFAYKAIEVDSLHWPASAPVGNHRGTVDDGIEPTNLLPWCARPFPKLGDLKTADGKPMPVCPDALISSTDKWLTNADIERWSYRGAISAGFAVFHYLDALSKGLTPVPPHDRCEALP